MGFPNPFPPSTSASDATITFTDITTNDVTTAKHGFFPKLPTPAGNYLKDDLTWGLPTAAAADLDSVLTGASTILANKVRTIGGWLTINDGGGVLTINDTGAMTLI